jgi:CDGSH-type Zn-finger protein
MAEPVCAQSFPYETEVEEGKTYFWCACGLSKDQPFCDMSHKGTGIPPVKLKPATSETTWLCGCKQTKTPPFCDGSHNSL